MWYLRIFLVEIDGLKIGVVGYSIVNGWYVEGWIVVLFDGVLVFEIGI